MLRYREGLLPLALLSAAGVVAVAMVVDPKGFSIREWQTLLAAFVALGAATLAYRAAMAKVALDETLHDRQTRRETRGVSMRARLALLVMAQDAAHYVQLLDRPKFAFFPRDIIIRTSAELDEAWRSLDLLPGDIASSYEGVKVELLNVEDGKRELGSDLFTMQPGQDPPAALLRLKNSLKSLQFDAERSFRLTEEYIARLGG